ncbi:hypothetical protein JKP88DRAFT_256288 [Tribonema minus]|uniref:Uncharacterized protein n=1 Tax=Tribonema minus TaxID=303371 RepID=A0A835YT67_9STRA|nr:hypothetical protein JKP88DRAFT_256288 [Tribonema minus]
MGLRPPIVHVRAAADAVRRLALRRPATQQQQRIKPKPTAVRRQARRPASGSSYTDTHLDMIVTVTDAKEKPADGARATVSYQRRQTNCSSGCDIVHATAVPPPRSALQQVLCVAAAAAAPPPPSLLCLLRAGVALSTLTVTQRRHTTRLPRPQRFRCRRSSCCSAVHHRCCCGQRSARRRRSSVRRRRRDHLLREIVNRVDQVVDEFGDSLPPRPSPRLAMRRCGPMSRAALRPQT